MGISDVPLEKRFTCPCCGFPTLSEAAAYEICELCNWEDDGQGDTDADAVRGGPNGLYSLAEARLNFRRYLVMYRPDHDTRVTGPDTPAELQAKRELIAAFEQLRGAMDPGERGEIVAAVQRSEAVLEAELQRGVREYEDKHRAGGAA
jgi:hypothetical protein